MVSSSRFKNKLQKLKAFTSFAALIISMKVSSSNSMSLEMRSRATPSKISSVLSSPAPTAASQQHSRT